MGFQVEAITSCLAPTALASGPLQARLAILYHERRPTCAGDRGTDTFPACEVRPYARRAVASAAHPPPKKRTAARRSNFRYGSAAWFRVEKRAVGTRRPGAIDWVTSSAPIGRPRSWNRS